jgi:hypothetical protein
MPAAQTTVQKAVEREVLEANRKFRRVLCAWAGDALALRRAGLDRPTFASAGPGRARVTGPLLNLKRKR